MFQSNFTVTKRVISNKASTDWLITSKVLFESLRKLVQTGFQGFLKPSEASAPWQVFVVVRLPLERLAQAMIQNFYKS